MNKSLVIKLASDTDYLIKIKARLTENNNYIDDFYNVKKFAKELEDSLISITG